MAKKKIKINNIIFTKIKHRYKFYSLYSNYGRRDFNEKAIADSFYPGKIAREVINPGGNLQSRPDNGYCISERVAEDTRSKKLHISELTTMLGYTKTDISKILQAVKRKELNAILVGLGGTGSNFMHWVFEMAQWTGKDRIFYKLSAYDYDEFDVPNMLRIPFIPEINTREPSAKKTKMMPLKFKLIASNCQFIDRKLMPEAFEAGELSERRMPSDKTFIYGAPDIRTREWMSRIQKTFFAATHRDDEYSIVENPTVDDDLMVETYGKIDLSRFFLNHLSMTIDFLKHLGERTERFGSPRQNEEIVRSDFSVRYESQLNNGFKAGAKKLYVIPSAAQEDDLELPEGEI